MNHPTARLVDDSGNELIAFTGDGVSNFNPLLRSLDFGYPAPRTVTSSRSGMDGDDDLTTYTGGRGITADLLVPVEGASALDTIRAVQHPGRRMWLYVQMPTWPAERRIRVRGASLSMAMGALPLPVQLGWASSSPTFQDATASSVTLSPLSSTSGGFSGPFSGPFSAVPGLVPGASVVTVGGTANAYPTVDIYGPCDGPVLRVVDTGQAMSFSGLSIAQGDYLHIDVAARSITLNNDPAAPRYDRLDFATSTWPALPPGSVQVAFSAATTGATTKAVVSWSSQWL